MKDQERRDLFARARDGASPSDDDRRRVRAALHRKIGVGAAAAVGVTATKAAAGMAPSAAVTGAVSGVSAAVVAKALVVVAVVAAASWVAIPRHSSPTRVAAPAIATTIVPPSSISASAVASPAQPMTNPVRDEPVHATLEKVLPSVVASHAPQAPTRTMPVGDREVPASATSQPPSPSPIEPTVMATPQAAEDVALLADIQLALRDGDSTRVLALVHEHERRFPASAWGPEREGARVLALCSQSQPDEAMRIGQRFLGDHPVSPLAARVRLTCHIADPTH